MHSITASRIAGLAALAAMSAPAAHASDVLVVGPSGSYPTIQSAVQAATSADIILVSPGTYAEDVTVTGAGRTIVARQGSVIDGSIEFIDVPANEQVLIAGLGIERPRPPLVLDAPAGAVHLEGCSGPVRLVDCNVNGAPAQYRTSTFGVPMGGPGVYSAACNDVAIIDSTVIGGNGAATVGPPGGTGGEGLLLSDVDRATVMRCLVFGGDGGQGDDGGDGGHGLRILGATTTHLDYSLFQGGDGLDPEPFMPYSGGSGGDGLVVGTQTVWDFQSIFQGGGFGIGAPGWPDGAPGTPVVSGAPLRTLNGHPSRLEIPLIVESNAEYARRVSGVVDEMITHEVSHRVGFGFARKRTQPRLIGAPAATSLDAVGPITGTSQFGAFIESATAPTLPPGVDAAIEWRSALCLDGRGGERRTSMRPLIVLRPGL